MSKFDHVGRNHVSPTKRVPRDLFIPSEFVPLTILQVDVSSNKKKTLKLEVAISSRNLDPYPTKDQVVVTFRESSKHENYFHVYNKRGFSVRSKRERKEERNRIVSIRRRNGQNNKSKVISVIKLEVPWKTYHLYNNFLDVSIHVIHQGYYGKGEKPNAVRLNNTVRRKGSIKKSNEETKRKVFISDIKPNTGRIHREHEEEPVVEVCCEIRPTLLDFTLELMKNKVFVFFGRGHLCRVKSIEPIKSQKRKQRNNNKNDKEEEEEEGKEEVNSHGDDLEDYEYRYNNNATSIIIYVVPPKSIKMGSVDVILRIGKIEDTKVKGYRFLGAEDDEVYSSSRFMKTEKEAVDFFDQKKNKNDDESVSSSSFSSLVSSFHSTGDHDQKIEGRDVVGRSIFHYLSFFQGVDIIPLLKILCESSSSEYFLTEYFWQRDNFGFLPIDIARYFQRVEVEEYLNEFIVFKQQEKSGEEEKEEEGEHQQRNQKTDLVNILRKRNKNLDSVDLGDALMNEHTLRKNIAGEICDSRSLRIEQCAKNAIESGDISRLRKIFLLLSLSRSSTKTFRNGMFFQEFHYNSMMLTHFATVHQKLEILRYLLEELEFPIDKRVEMNDVEIKVCSFRTKVVKKKSKFVHVVDGDTILHIASRTGNVEVVRYLLSRVKSLEVITMKNGFGQTPFEVISSRSRTRRGEELTNLMIRNKYLRLLNQTRGSTKEKLERVEEKVRQLRREKGVREEITYISDTIEFCRFEENISGAEDAGENEQVEVEVSSYYFQELWDRARHDGSSLRELRRVISLREEVVRSTRYRRLYDGFRGSFEVGRPVLVPSRSELRDFFERMKDKEQQRENGRASIMYKYLSLINKEVLAARKTYVEINNQNIESIKREMMGLEQIKIEEKEGNQSDKFLPFFQKKREIEGLKAVVLRDIITFEEFRNEALEKISVELKSINALTSVDTLSKSEKCDEVIRFAEIERRMLVVNRGLRDYVDPKIVTPRDNGANEDLRMKILECKGLKGGWKVGERKIVLFVVSDEFEDIDNQVIKIKDFLLTKEKEIECVMKFVFLKDVYIGIELTNNLDL